jgi:hypothetical protein
MKKDGSRKLVLNRETLKPLTNDELGKANGGESYSVSNRSISRNDVSLSGSRRTEGSSVSSRVSFSGWSIDVSLSGH